MTNKDFKNIVKHIKILINTALTCEFKINEYVPNTHLAETFAMIVKVVEFLHLEGLESSCLSEFKQLPTNENLEDFYQALRQKQNYFRNMEKLLLIRHEKQMAKYLHNTKTCYAKLMKGIQRRKLLEK